MAFGQSLRDRPAGVLLAALAEPFESLIASMVSPVGGRLGHGGEGGIRTLGTLAGTHDFQSCTFDHSVTSPEQTSPVRMVKSIEF
jgi:hypothetical protein